MVLVVEEPSGCICAFASLNCRKAERLGGASPSGRFDRCGHATAKKPAKKVSGAKGPLDAAAAVERALRVLANPAVERTVDRASQAVMTWAAKTRDRHRTKTESRAAEKLKVDDEGVERSRARFGQKGLVRRAFALREAAKAAFPNPTNEGRTELERALDEIDRYLAVVAHLPLVKRKQGHWKADNMLDQLEIGLVRALDSQRPA